MEKACGIVASGNSAEVTKLICYSYDLPNNLCKLDLELYYLTEHYLKSSVSSIGHLLVYSCNPRVKCYHTKYKTKESIVAFVGETNMSLDIISNRSKKSCKVEYVMHKCRIYGFKYLFW